MLINPEGGNLIVFDFNKPKIEITEISEDKKFGRFVVEPLERGYGTTPVSYTHLDVYKRQDHMYGITAGIQYAVYSSRNNRECTGRVKRTQCI